MAVAGLAAGVVVGGTVAVVAPSRRDAGHVVRRDELEEGLEERPSAVRRQALLHQEEVGQALLHQGRSRTRSTQPAGSELHARPSRTPSTRRTRRRSAGRTSSRTTPRRPDEFACHRHHRFGLDVRPRLRPPCSSPSAGPARRLLGQRMHATGGRRATCASSRADGPLHRPIVRQQHWCVGLASTTCCHADHATGGGTTRRWVPGRLRRPARRCDGRRAPGRDAARRSASDDLRRSGHQAVVAVESAGD